MGRITASGSLSLNTIKTTLGVSPSATVSSIRRGSGVGYTPNDQISMGNAYGAFTLGPAKIYSWSTAPAGAPVNNEPGSQSQFNPYIAATSPVPAGLGPGATWVNPGNGYYCSMILNQGGGQFYAATGSSSENIRTYTRILPYQVPWAQYFEGTGALGISLGPSTNWSGSLSYTNGVWMSSRDNFAYSYFNNIAFGTITSTSDYSGAVWSDGSTVYFGQLNAAQMMAGTFSATWSGAMFGIGSFARNSQCNHYYRFGGTGTTFINYYFWGIGVRGYAYNHDTTGITNQNSPNSFGFLKNTPGVVFPATHAGPGGGTVIG